VAPKTVTPVSAAPVTSAAAAPKPAAATVPGFAVPVLVVGQSDIGRLLRELETLDNQLLQLGLRASDNGVALPKTGRLLSELVQLNKLNLLDAKDRDSLKTNLETVKDHAPLLHISFSADPTTPFIEQLMIWLRREIHPQVLLTIGLQPTIGAGCIVRSTNKYFDCSLRHDFMNKRDLLLEKLMAATQAPPAAPVSGAAA
jgi:hypothetical protein